MRLEVIILSGGQSQRMGQEKGLSLFRGAPLISYPIELARQISENISIIANNFGYEGFGCRILADDFKNKGPLGGIATGLRAAREKNVLILPCDMPLLSADVITLLITKHGQFEATILKYKGRLHPLIGIYCRSLLPRVIQQIRDNELKVSLFVQKIEKNLLNVEAELAGVAPEVFANCNSRLDLKNLE